MRSLRGHYPTGSKGQIQRGPISAGRSPQPPCWLPPAYYGVVFGPLVGATVFALVVGGTIGSGCSCLRRFSIARSLSRLESARPAAAVASAIPAPCFPRLLDAGLALDLPNGSALSI